MAERRRYPKSTCCIMGCRRWSTVFPGDWMCAEHWRMVPRLWRAALRRSWKRYGAACEREQADRIKPHVVAADRAYAASERLWARAKRQVTLKAAGL